MSEWFDKLIEDPDSGGMSTLYPIGQRSPGAYYRIETFGTARLDRVVQPPGKYWIADFRTPYISVLEPVPVTHLQTKEDGDWRTWMVDEPAHWIMINQIARRIKGPRVAIAGLGLGLILHAIRHRRDIQRVTLVERSQHVIELMLPNIPIGPGQGRPWSLNIHHGDFWEWVQQIEPNQYDSFFIDLWRGPVTEHVLNVLEKERMIRSLHPQSSSLFFCFQDAVDRARVLAGA